MALSLNDVLHLNGQHDRYKPADSDSADPSYNGFVSSDGSWYILKQTISGDVVSFRYAKGASGYAAAWTDRATQTYDYFSTIFPS